MTHLCFTPVWMDTNHPPLIYSLRSVARRSVAPEKILFFTDLYAEAEAARAAGCRTCLSFLAILLPLHCLRLWDTVS